MRRRRLLGSLLCASLGACASPPPSASATAAPRELPVADATRQVVLCTTDGWDATRATVQLLERDGPGAPWRAVGAPIAATVGRAGLGLGLGEHDDRGADGPQKREGDGRAPAGVFAFGWLFGYADAPPAGVSMPYRQATARDYFVDDPDSADYNRWRRIPDGEPNDPAARWRSCERMRRDDHVYELGAVVGHNAGPTVPGRGSAIFLHVWQEPGAPTSGCTAMARADLLRLLRWLEPDAAPRFVQAPAAALASLRRRADG